MTLLTPADREFLARPLFGFLTVADGPVPPQPRPVWFEATAEDTIQLFTGPGTAKVRYLRKDPRASIIVSAPVGELEHWVSVAGRVTIESEGAHALVERLAARYWEGNEAARTESVAFLLAEEQVRIVIHPDKVRRFVNQ